MDRTSYSDPAVIALVADHFIPVRVDADDRPDISERYSLGGWPTTAFLTPDGEVIGGGTYVPVERMPGVLDQVVRAYRDRRDDLAAAPPAASPAHASIADIVAPDEALFELVFQQFDPEHGGFGVEPKFPHAAPVRVALDAFRARGDERMRDIAVTTLDAMGWSPLYDEVDGGFFRYAATRAWQLPHQEKLLNVNASMLSLYVHAAEVLQLARFAERADGVLRYVQTWLADGEHGGWFASQQADDRYYAVASATERRATPTPPVDERLFADWNAAMVSAALECARVTGDEGLRDFAIKSLERVVLGCYRPGGGVAHRIGAGAARGLLDDHVTLATAHLDAFEATGNVVYEMMAEELAHYALRTMWDETSGGFFDRIHDDGDVGLLRQRVKPFVANCQAARMLRRLAATSGESQFAEYAGVTSAAMARVAPAQGPLAAYYLLAVEAV